MATPDVPLVEQVEADLLRLRSGFGVTADSIVKYPKLMKLLGDKGAKHALERFRDFAFDMEETPNTFAASAGLGLHPNAQNRPRHERIMLIKGKIGLSEKSAVRYERLGIETFAHYLVEHGQGVSKDDLKAADTFTEEHITLESIYAMVAGLAESQYAMKRDIANLKSALKPKLEPRDPDAPPSTPWEKVFLDQQVALAKEVGQLHKVVSSLYTTARRNTPDVPDTPEAIINHQRRRPGN